MSSARKQVFPRQVWSLGQPALTLLLTLIVALFVVTPPAFSPSGATTVAVPPAHAEEAAAQTTGRSLVLPGQGAPGDLAPVAGPGMPAGDSRVVRLTVSGLERGYLLLPALGLGANETSALVVVLHQDVGSAQAVAEGLGLDGLRRRGVTLAYPAGVGGSWNAGGCCGVAMDQGVDDVGFVNAVLDDVGRHVPIDLQRRALVGYSGGGMLAYRVLCRAHPKLVAAVEVSGSLEAHCPSNVVLPDLLSIHGSKDGTIGLTHPIRVTHLGMSPRPVESTLTVMTSQGGCGGRTTTDTSNVRYVHWQGCRGGSTVDLQIVRGAGHGWESVRGAERAMPFLVSHLVKKA
jgi:polyhydroxybutyrate depolymerase